MLTAAHVIAMDAKNLLDVVDSVRVRYPELFTQQDHRSAPIQPQLGASDPIYQVTNQKTARSFDGMQQSTSQQPFSPNMVSSTDDSFDQMQGQTYQNLSEINEVNNMQASNVEIYANQEQIHQIHGSEGIYDNDCIINAQLKSLSIESDASGNPITNHSVNANAVIAENITTKCTNVPSKPPVAAKPSNIQQRIKALGFVAATSIEKCTASTVSNTIQDEPLKIIENETD